MSETAENTATDTAIGNALTKALGQSKRATRPAKPATPAKAARQIDAYAQETPTLDLARILAPHLGLMENIAQSFALQSMSQQTAEEVYKEVRKTTLAHLQAQGDLLGVALSEQAMKVHMQRIVGAYVGSACGAGVYYQRRVTVMRDMHSSFANEHRDEDRDGPVGFESKLARSRQFCAELAAQAFVLLASATGAVAAYEEVTGDKWKPYEKPAQTLPVSKQAAAAQLAAFEA
jgi:hypothetical protein